ncbi:MAG: 30S ribosomal protein S3 [bacterium]
MGHKVNPKIIRMNITRTWPSRWFGVGQKMVKNLEQDVRTRKLLFEELREAGLDRVEIERSGNKIAIGLFTAKPGVIIGRGGSGASDLKKKLHDKFLKNFRLADINLNITEFDRPNLSSMIIAQSMAIDIEKRMPFRRVMKQAINKAERAGALGVKAVVSGRLNGSEIARTEMLTSGKVPLHTLRADIDFAKVTARTTYGAIGIKFWIYKGDIFKKEEIAKGEIVGSKK